MKKILAICLFLSLSKIIIAQEDKGKDYSFISRIQGFYISAYTEEPNKTYQFINPIDDKPSIISGRKVFIKYKKKEGAPATNTFQLQETASPYKTIWYKSAKDNKNVYYMIKVLPLNYSDSSIFNLVWVHESIDQDKKGYSLTIIPEVIGFSEVKKELKKLTSVGRAELYTIYFKTNKYEFEPESEPTINEIVNFLNKEKDMKVTVVGAADTTGAKDLNQILSENRANYIKEAIVKKGINADRLKTIGVGETSDKTDKNKDKMLQLNRRTVLLREEAFKSDKSGEKK